MDKELVIDFDQSQRGSVVVINYKFKKRVLLKSGNISWRCAMVLSCKKYVIRKKARNI